jgi:type VI secretion system ImpH/TssG family protein
MASTHGPATDHMSFLRGAARDAQRYGFLALLRQAEARAPGVPRIGRSRQPRQNIADLAHASTLEFPGPTVEAIEVGVTSPPRMRVRSLFLGLTGPMGALPLHLTEFAHYERKYSRSQPFGRFLDLLTDRMLQFFFRAWADSQPCAQADRADDDRYASYLLSLTGLTGDTRAAAFPLAARLHYTGLLVTRRNPAAIQDFLSHLLGTQVAIREFVPRWRTISPGDRSRIGADGCFNRLGRGTVLGARTRAIDDSVAIVIRAKDFHDFQRRLPTQEEFAIAREALDAIVPGHLEWELELDIDERHAPPAAIGRTSRLGWTSWLSPAHRPIRRRDVRLRHEHAAFAARAQKETVT